MRSVLSSAFSWLVGLALAGIVYLVATHSALAQEQPISADPEIFKSENLLNPGYVMPVSLEDSVNSLDTTDDSSAEDPDGSITLAPDEDATAEADRAPSQTAETAQAAGTAGSNQNIHSASLTPDSTHSAGIVKGNSGKAVASGDSEEGTSTAETKGILDGVAVNYFGILHGPAVGDISAYQPKATGGRDLSHPIFIQNYINVSKELSEDVAVTAQGYWLYQPVLNQYVELMDPSLRVSNNRMIDYKGFNLYSDIRAHFPVSSRSRDEDMRFGIQTFQVASFTPEGSRLTVGAFGSLRYNFFGKQGEGRQVELYGAPNIAYQLSPKVALTALYEMGATNYVNSVSGVFYNDGNDLEPGVRWDVSESLSLSPYLTIMVNDEVSLKTTSIGMMVNWIVL